MKEKKPEKPNGISLCVQSVKRKKRRGNKGKMKKKLSYLFGISLVLISADQFTKSIILKNFREGNP